MRQLVVGALIAAAMAACSSGSDVAETQEQPAATPPDAPTSGAPSTSAPTTTATTAEPVATESDTAVESTSVPPPNTVGVIGPAEVFDSSQSDPAALRDPATWLSVIDADVERFTIYRVASARDIAPDEAELRIDRYIGGGFVSAEDLRGPEVGFGWQDVDLIVYSGDPDPGFSIVVGFGVDALTGTLEEAGFELVDEPAVYPGRPASLPVRGSALGIDRTNEVLVSGGLDNGLLGRALARTPSARSLAAAPVVQALLDVAGDAQAISISAFALRTNRYPQFLALADTHTVLVNGNLDACLLLPYGSAEDAETAAAMLVDDIAAGGDELALLADVDVTTSTTVMSVCQRDRADPDLFSVVFDRVRFPPFE